MNLPSFDYVAPRGLGEALEWLHEHLGEPVKVLAGGTDLLVDLRRKVIPESHRPRRREPGDGTPSLLPPHFVGADGHWIARAADDFHVPLTLMALSRIPELRGIRAGADGIHIGAMTTLADLEDSEIVRDRLGGLGDGAAQLGSPLVRNRGTYGGNLCNARPAADTAIPTLALGGHLRLRSVRGERTVAMDDFITGPGETISQPDELLTEVVFPVEGLGNSGEPAGEMLTGSGYIKLANRKSLEIAVVGAAAWVAMGEDERVVAARVALGAVAPTPLLAVPAGESLIGRRLDAAAVSEAARIAAEYARPITDHRGCREYRQQMIAVLVRRVLMRCRARALKSSLPSRATRDSTPIM